MGASTVPLKFLESSLSISISAGAPGRDPASVLRLSDSIREFDDLDLDDGDEDAQGWRNEDQAKNDRSHVRPFRDNLSGTCLAKALSSDFLRIFRRTLHTLNHLVFTKDSKTDPRLG